MDTRLLFRHHARCVLVLFLLVCLVRQGRGQTYFNERYASIGGVSSGATNVIVNDSGYVVFGETFHVPTWQSIALQVRFLSPDGHQRRVRYFQRAGMSYYTPFGGSGLMSQPGGGYLLAGSVLDSATQSARPMLWCFTATGDTLWTRQYSFRTNAGFYGGCWGKNQEALLVGTQWTPTDSAYGIVMRTDAAGNPLWQRHYNISKQTALGYASLAPDGGLLLGGEVANQAGIVRGLAIRIDSSGRQLWQRNFGPTGIESSAARGVVAHDGSWWITSSFSVGVVNGYTQMRNMLYHLSSQGQPLQQRAIGPARFNTGPLVIRELADGAIVVAGQQTDPTGATPAGNGFPEGFVFKVCATGDSLWYRTYRKLTGGNSHNYLRDLQPTPDGGFVGTGFMVAVSPDTGSQDTWAFKLDANGYIQPGGAPPTVQCAPTGLPHGDESDSGLEVWPNPSADGTFHLQTDRAATLTATDALGRVVWHGASSGATVTIDLSACAPGLYLLRLMTADGRNSTRKLMFEK